ncbi:hypothetical protein MVEN_01095100 [Mycena venus]|uniref:DyP dimeric alpha+beta barrel domain-containing protein n=1 Tax=Mycena venus TaxID=2733690 RepID=A0A8H6Y7H2_9AGAR|nr:hypothetical protein MVEN_01095100 [Mycena venus]
MADLTKHFRRRAVLPLLKQGKSVPIFKAGDTHLPDPDNLQGDIYLGFPKSNQSFLFFNITDPSQFRSALATYKPTTAKETSDLLDAIAEQRNAGNYAKIDQYLTGIAFSLKGLKTLGLGSTGDSRFDTRPMRQDKEYLGDGGQWDDVFEPASIHGVILVCGPSESVANDGVKYINTIFSSSCTFQTMNGNVRPGEFKGHEHFGWQDGVSQPSLRGMTHTYPGQLEVDPGVLITGYKGDPVFDNPSAPQRPTWARDGSFMVFRKLEQDVKYFNDYMERNWKKWRYYTPVPDEAPPEFDTEKEAAIAFIGATLLGRWKSGTPIALAHWKDDLSIGDKPEKTNNFDYSVTGDPLPSNRYCPFNAHARKTNPRNLDPYISRKFLESCAIARQGIPYGTEYTPTSTDTRGLLFVCYQSSLDSGFVRQTVGMSANDFFPVTGLIPKNHGQDPITGGPPANVPNPLTIDKTIQNNKVVVLEVTDKSETKYEITGFAQQKVDSLDAFEPGPYPVNSRGGEYFFMPSVSALKNDFTKPPPSGVDLLFLQDYTGSMQPFVDAASSAIDAIYDNILRNGNWSRNSVQVVFDFTSDMGTMGDNLKSFKAEGGGDMPEAQCEAIAQTLEVAWDDNHTKIAVLITDSSPHGIGEPGDKIPDGCPDQNDPLALKELMIDRGIVLYVLACEPKMSSLTRHAIDYWSGVASATGGKLLPLSKANDIGSYIQKQNTELVAHENLVRQFSAQVKAKSAEGLSTDSLVSHLRSEMTKSAVTLPNFKVEEYFVFDENAKHNVQVWAKAKKRSDVNNDRDLRKVTIGRVQHKFKGQDAPSPTQSLETSAITKEQVDSLVRKCLRRS